MVMRFSSQSDQQQNQQPRNILFESKIISGPEGIKSDLLCIICSRLMLDTSICIPCEKAYCTHCIDLWNKEGQGCLYCNGQNFRRQKPQLYDDFIKLIKIDCPFSNNNNEQKCDRIQMSFNEAQEHIKTCQYQVIKCQNQDCCFEGLRQQYQLHKTQCEFRSILCIHCNNQYQNRFLNEHDKICPKKQIKCPHCNSLIYQTEMENHKKNVCLEVEDPCSYCNLNYIRRVIKIHRQKCPKKPVDCVCNKTFLQEQFEEHQQQCLEVKISCANCNKIYARSEEHTNKDCIKFLSSKCNQVESDVFILNEQIKEIRQYLRLPDHQDEKQFYSFVRSNQN